MSTSVIPVPNKPSGKSFSIQYENFAGTNITSLAFQPITLFSNSPNLFDNSGEFSAVVGGGVPINTDIRKDAELQGSGFYNIQVSIFGDALNNNRTSFECRIVVRDSLGVIKYTSEAFSGYLRQAPYPDNIQIQDSLNLDIGDIIQVEARVTQTNRSVTVFRTSVQINKNFN